MAERNGQEKTEKPTGKRRSDTKKRGNVFQSKDISTVTMLLGVFMMARFMMPCIYITIRGYLAQIITGIGGDVVQLLSSQLLMIMIISPLKYVLPPLLTAAVLGILPHGTRARSNVAFQALQPRFSKLSPITGTKNLFSLKKVAELLKNLMRISLLLALLYNLLKGDIVPIAKMTDMNPFNPAAYMMNMVFNLVIKIYMTFTVVALFDFLYQHWEYEQDLRTIKREVKDEYGQTKENPGIRGRIRRTQRRMALSRMIQRVPQADVIVRSLAHFVVALKYGPDKSGAPIVLVKGQDELALQTTKAGEENGITIIENRLLTRTSYVSCEPDREIPAELYGAVAGILVFICKVSHQEDMLG